MKKLRRSDVKSGQTVRLVVKGGNEIVPADTAFARAEADNLDLVCVSDTVDPMVVRIEDLKKVEFEKKKAKKSQKAKSKQNTLKEMQFRLRIAEHDLNIKLDKVRNFLDRGDKVKAVVRLRGRERANPEQARELIKDIVNRLDADVTHVGGAPHIAILEPAKTGTK